MTIGQVDGKLFCKIAKPDSISYLVWSQKYIIHYLCHKSFFFWNSLVNVLCICRCARTTDLQYIESISLKVLLFSMKNYQQLCVNGWRGWYLQFELPAYLAFYNVPEYCLNSYPSPSYGRPCLLSSSVASCYFVSLLHLNDFNSSLWKSWSSWQIICLFCTLKL